MSVGGDDERTIKSLTDSVLDYNFTLSGYKAVLDQLEDLFKLTRGGYERFVNAITVILLGWYDEHDFKAGYYLRFLAFGCNIADRVDIHAPIVSGCN